MPFWKTAVIIYNINIKHVYMSIFKATNLFIDLKRIVLILIIRFEYNLSIN